MVKAILHPLPSGPPAGENNGVGCWRVLCHSGSLQWSVVLEVLNEKKPEKEILAQAKHRLVNHPHLNVQRIWCEYKGKRLYLRGHVPSFYLKQLAQEAVSDMQGVSQVVNEIEVLW